MLSNRFIKPKYGSGCFADLPATIHFLLTGKDKPPCANSLLSGIPNRYKTVIFFLVDAFGYNFYDKYRNKYSFLRQIEKQGKVIKITSQFPSTTACHVTTIHTGSPVSQSGIYEWQYYDPNFDAVIMPLPYAYAGMRGSALPTDVDTSLVFPTRTLYQSLHADNVNSYLFSHVAIADSVFNRVVSKGARIHKIRTLPEMLVNLQMLLKTVRSQDQSNYIFLYFSNIDTISHHYGPNSPQLDAEIGSFLSTFENFFWRRSAHKLKDTLLMITADHGQTSVDPETTIYLNRDPRFEGIKRFIRKNRRGELIVPAGSCRDMFLYIKDGLWEEAQQFLSKRLAGKAKVCKTADLIDHGYFGPAPPSRALLERVGDLVILPYIYESVWWYEKDKFEQNFYGHHGGLTRDEMEIPLMLYPF